LSACIDYHYKFLISEASYPNFNIYNESFDFCLVAKKILKSCSGEKKESIEMKFPNLCSTVLSESSYIDDVDCRVFQSYGEDHNPEQVINGRYNNYLGA
jgi:hypothetical protein